MIRSASASHLTKQAIGSISLLLISFNSLLAMAAPREEITPIPEPETPNQLRIAPNDVSILFALPESQADLDKLIKLEGLSRADGQPIIRQDDFTNLIAVSESPASAVGNKKITFDGEIKGIDSWHIAGIRIDPTAVGGSSSVADVFGQSAQIRLIVQPVTISGTRTQVHDVTLHLIYSFAKKEREGAEPPCKLGKSKSDLDAFQPVIDDLLEIKQFCESKGIRTDESFSIHPASESSDVALEFRDKVASFLATHLHPDRLNSSAVMGLHNRGPEPWIFMAMLRQSGGKFGPFPAVGVAPLQEQKLAQMISFLPSDAENVLPSPATTNRQPHSDNLCLPTTDRRGISTAPLFEDDLDLSAPAIIGEDAQGDPTQDSELTNADIADFIAHPEKAHFFNTDCASCHSESTRRSILNIPTSTHAYEPPIGTPEVDPGRLPTHQWNVRNFGWFESSFVPNKRATISLRTVNETAEVVEFINENMIK